MYVLLLACEAKKVLNDEADDILNKTFRTTKDSSFIEFILFAPSHDSTIPLLQQIDREVFGYGFVTGNGGLNV